MTLKNHVPRMVPCARGIGMEATGNIQWFIELVQDLGHEIWIGDAAALLFFVYKKHRPPGVLAFQPWIRAAGVSAVLGEAGSPRWPRVRLMTGRILLPAAATPGRGCGLRGCPRPLHHPGPAHPAPSASGAAGGSPTPPSTSGRAHHPIRDRKSTRL